MNTPTGQFPAADDCSKCNRTYKTGDITLVFNFHSYCAQCSEAKLKSGAVPTAGSVFQLNGHPLSGVQFQKAAAQLQQLVSRANCYLASGPVGIA